MYVQLHEDGTFWRKVRAGRDFVFGDSCSQPPETLTPEEATLYRVLPLTRTDRPAFNAITQSVVESDPAPVAGVWTQQWSVVDLSPEVAAANQAAHDKLAADAAISDAVRLDPTLQYLRTHTAAEIGAKVQAEVTSLATAKAYIAKLAVAVGALVRNEARGRP